MSDTMGFVLQFGTGTPHSRLQCTQVWCSVGKSDLQVTHFKP